MGIKMTAVKVWVSDDGATGYFIKSNVFCIQIRGAGNDHGVPDAFGVLQTPTQGLHPA